jgi:hypothetical protein
MRYEEIIQQAREAARLREEEYLKVRAQRQLELRGQAEIADRQLDQRRRPRRQQQPA